MEKINLKQKFSLIQDYWNPRVVAEMNGQQVRLAKLKGPFIWHRHEHEDELFWIHRGELQLEFRDKSLLLKAGEMAIVPKGVEHRPVAKEEVELVLIEPASTINTGEEQNDLTRDQLQSL